MKRAAVVLLALASAACGSARSLREAQDHFNRGAEIENQARFQRSGSGLRVPAGAEAEYRLALAKVEGELAEHLGELQSEGLWFTARLLKALCLWRVAALGGGTPEQLARVRGEVLELSAAKDQGRVSPGPRDRALLAALPGLLDHEKGLRTKDPADFKSAVVTVEKALAAENPPQDHEVRLYLRLAQMTSAREWIKAAPAAELAEANKGFTTAKNDLKAAVEGHPELLPVKELGLKLCAAAGVTW